MSSIFKRMKKLLSVALIASFLLVFTACGTEGNSCPSYSDYYTKAYILLPGKTIAVDITEYHLSSAHTRVTTVDGTVYSLGHDRIILVRETNNE